MTFRTNRIALSLALSLAVLAAGTAQAKNPALPRTATPEGASVYIISPTDGETVSSPVTVRFGLKGMGVGPAGLDNPKTGHHHLIIDAPLPDPNLPIPADDKHRHFGGGQTEVTLELTPGPHSLQLMLGDLNHIPHTRPLVSERIEILVE
jgi:hypothetical protein